MPEITILYTPESHDEGRWMVRFEYPDLAAIDFRFPSKAAAENAIKLAQFVANEQISLSHINYK